LRYKRSSAIIYIVVVLGTLNFLIQRVVAGEFEFANSISLSESYNDNIYKEASEEEEDLITSLTPGFTLSYITQKTNLRAAYSPELQFYANNSDENDINHSANLGFNSRLTKKLTVMVVDNLVFIPAYEALGREVGARSYASDQWNNKLNATLSYRMFRYTSLRLESSYRFVDYEKNYLEDSYEYSYVMGIDHELTDRDILSFNYEYRSLFYDWENDADIQSISIGETHEFAKGLVLGASGGIELIDEEDEESKSDWSAGLSITKNFRRANMGLAYNRRTSISEGAGGTSVIQPISLNGRKEFSKRFNGNFKCFFSTQESTAGDDVDNEDYGLKLGSSYEFTKRLNGTIACSYIYQNSEGSEGEDTKSYRGRIGAVYLIRPLFSTFFSYSYYQQNILDQDEKVEEDMINNIFTAGIQVTWL
jgi:hypothetical protein